jgi:predicted ATPase
MSARRERFVLTGGPGGGKSSVAEALRASDPNAERWMLVPEAASLMLSAGLSQGTKRFQAGVVRVQLALEDSIAAALDDDPGPDDRVMVCDRGTLDSLAYWRLCGWDDKEFFDVTGLTLAEHLGRYDGVIHLETTAIGAEDHYRRGQGTGRLEPPEEAAHIDALIAEAWRDHKRLVRIDNAGRDWPTKLDAALDVIQRWSE